MMTECLETKSTMTNEEIDKHVAARCANEMIRCIDTIASHSVQRTRSRELNLAVTKVQEALMWIRAHVDNVVVDRARREAEEVQP